MIGGWFRRIFSRRDSGTWLNILPELIGQRSSSGTAITPDGAMGIPAVYTAVRIIGGTVGALPMHVYRAADDGGRDIARRHWAYSLLHDSPNEFHTAATWRETLVAHILLWGNAYARIDWMRNGAARALYPLMPWTVEPKLTKSGQRYYELRLPSGREDLADYEVLHIPGLSYDGVRGVSVVGQMRDALGLAKASETFAAKFLANGAKPGAILETPGRMNELAQKRLAESLQERFGNAENAFKMLVLEQGAKLHTYTMPLKDAQFLEIRKFQRSEILAWYGVPPHLGGDSERQTSWGSGVEQMDLAYSKHTITPLCVRIEQELNRKLFGRGSDFYCKHNLDGLQRGDFLTRMQGLQIAVGRPFMSVNEARALSDMNRMADAGYDEIALPLNTSVGASPAAPKMPVA